MFRGDGSQPKQIAATESNAWPIRLHTAANGISELALPIVSNQPHVVFREEPKDVTLDMSLIVILKTPIKSLFRTSRHSCLKTVRKILHSKIMSVLQQQTDDTGLVIRYH